MRIIDACRELSVEQLETTVPGTYGSIIDTARHLVDADVSYLFVLSDGRRPEIEVEQADLAELKEAMRVNRPLWAELVARELAPDANIVRQRDDGTSSHAPMGIRLPQVLHHGTDHRSQICTALTSLGIEPPEIDVWDFGRETGQVFVTPTST